MRKDARATRKEGNGHDDRGAGCREHQKNAAEARRIAGVAAELTEPAPAKK